MFLRPPRSTLSSSSAASDVYKRQLLDRAVAAIQDDGDVAIGLAGGDPAVYLALPRRERPHGVIRAARRRARARAQAAVQTRQKRADAVEQLALAVGEVAVLAVQDEAHQHVVVDEDRQGDDVVDADSPVVLVVQGAFAKTREGHRVADPVRASTPPSRMKADQRMLREEAVEAEAILDAETRVGKADDVAAPASQMA